jgi:hypothetical protein
MPDWLFSGSCFWYLWLAINVLALIGLFTKEEGQGSIWKDGHTLYADDRLWLLAFILGGWFLYFMFHYVMFRGG